MFDGIDPRTAGEDPGRWRMPVDGDPRPDPGTGLGQFRGETGPDPLSRAVDALREQLTIANRRADRAEQRVDELQAALAEERQRVIAILTGPRRPWWRRWFR